MLSLLLCLTSFVFLRTGKSIDCQCQFLTFTLEVGLNTINQISWVSKISLVYDQRCMTQTTAL
ncbi:rCG42244, isoform CRA_b [Rattus norvegicus]|uniref:RCG42244, isoform CRA_b n=1 Tax=Rattus norvegicus TaxID=10116 RepID=A6KU84_RAT|nr:rCG42244, isoform CRA_b [Rattus norvegicus]